MPTDNVSPESVHEITGLLVSILLRYPEVATVSYDPDMSSLRFTFVTIMLADEERADLESTMVKAICAYYHIRKSHPLMLHMEWQDMGCFDHLIFYCDAETFSLGLLDMLADLFAECFPDVVQVLDEDRSYRYDYPTEELLDSLMDNVRANLAGKTLKIIAYRDEGRVVVFNQ